MLRAGDLGWFGLKGQTSCVCPGPSKVGESWQGQEAGREGPVRPRRQETVSKGREGRHAGAPTGDSRQIRE